MLAMYRRKPDEAEAILLQAGLVFRAIKLNVKLFNFERALELAKQYKVHEDTVLYYRLQYLKAANQQETIAAFMQLADTVCGACAVCVGGGGHVMWCATA